MNLTVKSKSMPENCEFSMKQNLFFVTIFLSFLFLGQLSANSSNNAFYAFYPSKLGENYKRLEHNILGFQVDMPNDWQFGVNGVGVQTVAILYPSNVNTSEFSEDYVTIEIGIVSIASLSLSEALENIVIGMKSAHKNRDIKIRKTENPATFRTYKSAEVTYEWVSNNGTKVLEQVTLIQYNDQIRSIAIRSSEQGYRDTSETLKKIVNTYEPIDVSAVKGSGLD